MATKREIERAIRKLMRDVSDYNSKCKENSLEEAWTFDLYEHLVDAPRPPKATASK